MIPLFTVFNHPDSLTYVSNVLQSGQLAQGPMNKRFEDELSGYLEIDRICTVNSCTSAIHLAIDLIKRYGEAIDTKSWEVICSPLTCAAGIWPFKAHGLNIVWTDIEDSFNIDLDKVKEGVTEHTRILSYVNWGGMPVDYAKVAEIQEWYKSKFGHTLYVIEDCAHAFGSSWNDKKLGTVLEDSFACYSFQAIKSLTTGDGGLLIPPSNMIRSARLLRWFGLDRDNKIDFRSCQDIVEWGYKFHMNDITSAIGIANLPHIDSNLDKHRNAAKKYHTGIDNPKIRIPYSFNSESSYWLFTLLVDDKNSFTNYMLKNGIQVNPVHRRVDETSAGRGTYRCLMDKTEVANKHMMCIPTGWWLSELDVDHIIKTINEY